MAVGSLRGVGIHWQLLLAISVRLIFVAFVLQTRRVYNMPERRVPNLAACCGLARALQGDTGEKKADR